VHAYWPLEEALAPPEAERANLRLATALGADRVCFDAARILRPPATWNHKHAPATPVAVVRFEPDTRFDASFVVAGTPEIDDARLQRRWVDRRAGDTHGDPLLRIEPAVYVSALLRVRARPGRKVHCPFHTDSHPSLHVYPTAARGWCCFSCGRGGSIYDLGSALLNLGTKGRDFLTLKRQLTDLFAGEIRRTHRKPPDRVVDRFE
jgi:hypothetical protein